MALIPARSGSKRLPGKNIKKLGGISLVERAIKSAQDCGIFDHIVVSTDDPNVIDLALAVGAQVPFARPVELCQDDSKTVDVIRHALNEIPGCTHLMLLQPTSPFRTSSDILNARNIYEAQNCMSSVVSVREVKVPGELVFRVELEAIVKTKNNVDIVRLDPASHGRIFVLNGACYFASRDWYLNNDNIVHLDSIGYVMDEISSIDIDTIEDWAVAEALMEVAYV